MVPAAVMLNTYDGVEGIVASPPCPPFSATGTGDGVKDIASLIAAIGYLARGIDTRREIRDGCADPRSLLSVEPLRWVLTLRPQWTAWEQVPGGLPIWQAAAQVLADCGYSVWVGMLDAYDYGVPQNRKRAILMAHRSRMVSMPTPTTHRVMRQVVEGPHPDAVLRMGRSRGTARTLDEPAPTIMFGKSPNDVGWYMDGIQLQSLSLREALALQTFPADYPVAGKKVSSYRQVGDAVPRLLGDEILRGMS